jgi:hypothetical protein
MNAILSMIGRVIGLISTLVLALGIGVMVNLPVSKPELALNRIYNIDCPVSDSVITRDASIGSSLVTVTDNGIPLSAWDALY